MLPIGLTRILARTHTRPWVTRVWQIGFAPTTTTRRQRRRWLRVEWWWARVCGAHIFTHTHTPIFRAAFYTHTHTNSVFNLTRSQSRNTRNTRENMTARRRRLTSRKTARRASVTSQSISVRKPIRWRMETIGRAKNAYWRRLRRLRRRWRWRGHTHRGQHRRVITTCEYTIWVRGSKIVIIIIIIIIAIETA